ncbi:MAG TPA: amidohydrolase family protein [Vicinamibacteria bacterium]
MIGSVPLAASCLAILGARIHLAPAAPPIEDGVVLVCDGSIAAVGERSRVEVPESADRVDARGLSVAYGFWNSHVHFTEPSVENAGTLPAEALEGHLRDMLTRWGFTTVVDAASFLANTLQIRERIQAGEVAGPEILTAGAPLYPPNGVPYYVKGAVPPEVAASLPQPASAAEAIPILRANLDGGADLTKVFVTSWVARGKTLPMPLEVIEAAAEETHSRGKLLFAHPSLTSGIELALQGGVDILGHSVEDPENFDDALVRRLVEARVSLVPTLELFAPSGDIDAIAEALGRFSRAGGRILFGTDVGFRPDYDTTKEYELMARAGLSFDEILASLTTAPAGRFGQADRKGTIEPGKEADLVVFEGDPRADIRSLARVRYTIREGRVIWRAP